MKYLYKIGLILSVVLTAGACSGQLDTIQEYLDAGETIYAAKMDSVDIRPGYNRVEVTGLLKYVWIQKGALFIGHRTMTL